MTIRISAKPADRSQKAMALRLLLPVIAFVAYGLWRGHSPLLLIGVSVPLVLLSFWAVQARTLWQAIEVGPESISLVSAKETVVIRREELVKLEVRDKLLAIKWQAQPKARLAVLGKERFTDEAWAQLRSALQPWEV